MGLYVAKDRNRTVVSRAGLRVRRQVRVDPRLPAILFIGLPTIVVVLAGLRYFGPLMALLAGLVVLRLTGFLVPRLVRRRLVRRRVVQLEGGIELTAAAERTAFDRAATVADRVAKTWPALDGLIDVPEAEALLAEALWEIAGGLARRQELKAVLAQLTRPDFAAVPAADATAAKLQAQIRATKEALSAIEIDLAGRLASLERAEEAGRTLIREREMHEAIRAAERSLAAGAPPARAMAAAPASDPAADLAEHTHLVLAAYRELTTTLHPEERP